MNSEENLKQYYESYDEDGRLSSSYGMVEYLTTMRFIEKYLKTGAQIIEIGAGTGRYSHTLAKKGYHVDAVELIAHNIEVFKSHTEPDEPVTISQGNALDLSAFPDNTYDITLLLGPMYHLFTKEEQLKALSEAIRVTKPNGVVFAAYCMGDASILLYGFGRGHINEIIEKCMIDISTFNAFPNPWDLFQLYRTEDINELREHFKVAHLHQFAADGYANHIRETLAEMDEDTFNLFLKYHFATCERQGLMDISNHVVDVFRKI